MSDGITINKTWKKSEKPTHLCWISEDQQSDLVGPKIEGRKSLDSQMRAFAQDLIKQGVDGGEVHLYIVIEKNPAAVTLGRIGGSKKSVVKTVSSAANGKLGGRPAAKFEARAFGLCSAKGITESDALKKCAAKARKMMRDMKASGQLPQISVVAI